MKVLILNRRDIANPAGGGAETYTHEIARGLVAEYGCEVTVFASSFHGCRKDEVIDGVRYLRRGNEATVHLSGFFHAIRNRKYFDRIIDEFNGVGFFTFLLPNSLLLIHQLYREFWFRELGPAGLIPYILEPLLLRLYRGKTAITVSDSTRRDLERLGFREVRVVMNAIAHFSMKRPAEKSPALVFLGRLRRTKRPEYAIDIFQRAKEKMPELELWMVGRGPDEKKLKEKARGLQGITFWGWVDEEEKRVLLDKASLLLVPSIREGFGINVIEAAASGTPAIGFDVPGLRDSILDGKTGFLVRSADDAAVKVVALLQDRRLYEEISDNCLEYSRQFQWEKRVEDFWKIMRAGALTHPEPYVQG